jgi:acyl carrier protein
MTITEHEVQHTVIDILNQLATDWEYGAPITTETYLFGDLGFESLDLVVLGTSLQERYGRLPFAELLADLGQRPLQDLSIGELVEFIAQHSNRQVVGEAR